MITVAAATELIPKITESDSKPVISKNPMGPELKNNWIIPITTRIAAT